MDRAAPTTASRFVRALRDDVAGEERARLVAGMAEALNHRPYPEVTVEDVVARARMPSARFFAHFADTEACFLATYEASAALLRAETIAAVVASAGQPYEERIALGVRAYLETLADEPGLARAFLRDVTAAGPEALRRRDTVNARFAAMIVALAEQHADELPEGYAVHPDMARELVDALEELILIAVADDRPQDLPRLTQTATRMIHAALVVGDDGVGG